MNRKPVENRFKCDDSNRLRCQTNCHTIGVVRILRDLWRRVTSHHNLHIYDVIASSLRSDKFWHFRSVLLYELSHTVIQLNAQ